MSLFTELVPLLDRRGLIGATFLTHLEAYFYAVMHHSDRRGLAGTTLQLQIHAGFHCAVHQSDRRGLTQSRLHQSVIHVASAIDGFQRVTLVDLNHQNSGQHNSQTEKHQ